MENLSRFFSEESSTSNTGSESQESDYSYESSVEYEMHAIQSYLFEPVDSQVDGSAGTSTDSKETSSQSEVDDRLHNSDWYVLQLVPFI